MCDFGSRGRQYTWGKTTTISRLRILMNFQEIFANFGNRKSAKCKCHSPGRHGPYFAKYFSEIIFLKYFYEFSSKSPTRFSSGVTPRILLTFRSKPGKWRKYANFPEISDISATFHRSLRRSRNFAHLSCEKSSFPCFSHLFALLGTFGARGPPKRAHV